MTGLEFVAYFLRMHDISKEKAEGMARESLSELGLELAMDRKINTYSRGMRQKTKVARATVTILVSSHILHDVQSLTDNIALINNGKMLAYGNRHEIRDLINIPRPISIVPVKKGNLRKLAKIMIDKKWTKATAIDEENNELTIETNQSEEIYLELPKILQKEKITVEKIYSEDDSLDSLYSKLVEGAQWK